MQLAHANDEHAGVLINKVEEQLHGFVGHPPATLQIDAEQLWLAQQIAAGRPRRSLTPQVP